jgi:hypothetical protein
MNWKSSGRKWSWPNLMNYTGICILEEQNKTIISLSEYPGSGSRSECGTSKIRNGTI